MKKYILILFVFSIFSLSPAPANAFLTFDTTKGVGKLFNNVSNFAKQVQDKITDLQNKIMGKKWIQDGINAAKWAKNTHDATVKMVKKYKQLYNDVRYSDAVVMAEKTAKIAKVSRQIKDLESQKQEAINSLSVANDAQVVLLNGKIKVLEENNAYYTEAQDEDAQVVIEQNNQGIKELQAQITTINATQEGTIKQATQAIDTQITSLENQKSAMEDDLKNMGMSLVSDFLKDSLALAMSTDINFVAQNEQLTTEAVEKIRKNRVKERNAVLKEAFSKAIAKKALLNDKSSERASFSKMNNGFEEVSANILTLTEGKVDDIEDLLVYVELMLLDMKVQTAVDLSLLTQYKMEDGTKNLEVFDLKDYVFDYKKYKDAQLRKQPLRIGSMIDRGKNTLYNIKNEVNGGLANEAKNFGDYIVNPDNAGYDTLNNNELYRAQQDTERLKNSLDYSVERAINLGN